MWESSVCSDLRNLRRAGVLKKRSRRVMVVPTGRPASSTRRMLPPAISTRVPEGSSATRVSRVRRETLAIDGRAAPRKPRVAMESRSPEVRSLEVAWRSKARRASSATMPWPLSLMRMSLRPPASTSMRMRVAPASREFSRSSLTTEAGRSTTSPAAIWFATTSERMRMRPMLLIVWPAQRGKTGAELKASYRKKETHHDSQTEDRRVPHLFASRRTEDGKAEEPGHLHHTREGRAAGKGDPVLQTPLRSEFKVPAAGKKHRGEIRGILLCVQDDGFKEVIFSSSLWARWGFQRRDRRPCGGA